MTSLRAASSILMGLALLAASSACHRYTTRVPGIVDLRTDGSAAPVAEDVQVPRRAARDGLSALALGEGASASLGGAVRVEDRHYWLLGAIPIVNESAREEISAVLAPTGALRGVELGEELSALDVVFGILGRNIPFGAWLLPPWTFVAQGEAIRLEAGAATTCPERAPNPPPSPAPFPAPSPPEPEGFEDGAPPALLEPPPLLDEMPPEATEPAAAEPLPNPPASDPAEDR